VATVELDCKEKFRVPNTRITIMTTSPSFTRCLALLAVTLWLAGFASASQAQTPLAELREQDLIEALRTAPPAEKAIACKQLAVHGTKEAVADLAKLLGDEQFSSWARIALEAIPDPAADEALREALDQVDGNLLVGVINSIGVRRDASAVEPLAARLSDANAEVASAAAVALGHIGDSAATAALRKALAEGPEGVRSAVAEGCVLCAERLMNEGKPDDAAAIYDEVRKADVPQQRVIEATRGAILARKSDGIPLLLEQLQSTDKHFVHVALGAARELTGTNVAESLARQLGALEPQKAALLLYALADRQEPVLPSAVLEAAGSGDKQVRIAAIGVLGRVVDPAGLSALLEVAAEEDAEIVESAKSALGNLPGENVDGEIVARLADASGKPLAVLIELVGFRRIQATGQLVKALETDDPVVRQAALHALGATVQPQHLRVLVQQVLEPRSPEDAASAKQALMAASVRMPDRDACAAALTEAMRSARSETKVTLLEIIGAVGGAKALDTLNAAATGQDAQLQDAATRLLGEWMNVDAAPVLLELANNPSNNRYQVRALRGYIRLARQFAASDALRAEMCRSALAAARRPEERQLVLTVLESYPSLETLQVAVEAAQKPELRQDASRVAREIAERVEGRPNEVRELLKKVQ
jgi:HEAT repeat protein